MTLIAERPLWKPISEPMTTDNRLVRLTMAELTALRHIAAHHKEHHPYDGGVDLLDVLDAKLQAGPTHQHIQKGTQLRLIGGTRRKNDEVTLAIYETPCRIVFVMPEAEFQLKTITL